MSDHCAFRDYLDHVLCDRLICGFTSEAMQKQLLTEKDLTLAKTQEIAMGMKTTAKEASELKISSKAPKVNSLTQVNSKSRFHCGKKGHTSEDCYFRMQKMQQIRSYLQSMP